MVTKKKEETKKTEKPTTYTKEELINGAETAFNTRPQLMAGALHGVDDPITKAEAEKLLDKFKKHPVN